MLGLGPSDLPCHPGLGVVPIMGISGILLTEHLVADAIPLVHDHAGNGGVVMARTQQSLDHGEERPAAVGGPIWIAVTCWGVRILSCLDQGHDAGRYLEVREIDIGESIREIDTSHR